MEALLAQLPVGILVIVVIVFGFILKGASSEIVAFMKNEHADMKRRLSENERCLNTMKSDQRVMQERLETANANAANALDLVERVALCENKTEASFRRYDELKERTKERFEELKSEIKSIRGE